MLFSSEALQSVALELVIFGATIVVAIVMKVGCFDSGCAASFRNYWPAAWRHPPSHRPASVKEVPSAEKPAAAAPQTQHGAGRKERPRLPLNGSARTLENIMELAINRNASEALSRYAELRVHKGDQMQDLLRAARRSGLEFYSALVQSAVRVDKPEMVEQILNDMGTARIERTLSFYESVMKVLAGKKHYRQALAVYNRLSSEGLKASPVTLSCLVNFTAELGDFDGSIKFFEQLEATSKPSIRAYMVALRVYSKRQEWPKSLEIVRSMQTRSVPVDSLILNTVLATGVATGKTEAAEELLHELSGDKVADVISYNTVLKGYAHQKISDKALKLLESMLARGTKPNGITFNTVMDATVRGGQVDEAWKILDLMQEAAIKPDKYTCTIMMKAVHEDSTPKQLSRLIDMIQSALPQCDSVLAGSLFRGLFQVAAKLKNSTLLMRALNQMKALHVTPTSGDYQIILQTLAQQCDTAGCSAIWRAALAPATDGNGKKLQPATAVIVAIFSSLMECLAQEDEVEAMICAFESLVAVVPACDPCDAVKPRTGLHGSQKSLENDMPLLLQQCRASLIQAASRKQNSSPAFKRLIELADEQGLPLDTLMQCQ